MIFINKSKISNNLSYFGIHVLSIPGYTKVVPQMGTYSFNPYIGWQAWVKLPLEKCLFGHLLIVWHIHMSSLQSELGPISQPNQHQ